jgi:hypothetical protein
MNGTVRFLIAAPAAVAVWSAWAGLGGMCGFGLVQPFQALSRWARSDSGRPGGEQI